MAPSRGETSYRKQNGILAISSDRNSVSWTPAAALNGATTLTLNTSKITNLQQTPESSAKVMLKIFAQEAGQTEPVSHVFTFTNKSEARGQANGIKDVLTLAIQAQKAAQTTANGTGGHSTAITIANAVSGGGNVMNLWEDDERLKKDVQLQQSLMEADRDLRKTFLEAKDMRPESLSVTQFTAQFWSSRVAQLRAHAIAKSQGRGRYNVFSELRKEEGGTKMNLTQEHVRVIFEQYPVMRTIHDEVIPAKIKDERLFWSHFFQSQLFMTLRGLKFDRTKEAKDPILDQYLDHPELTGARATSAELHIPKFIDLEGNEENHSQRKGNRPDTELRQNTLEKAPIIRRLNALSEKIMASVKPADTDASAPIGMNEATYDQLRLRDLAGDPEQNKIILNIRDQSRFFADNLTADGDQAHHIDPTQALRSVCSDLSKTFPQSGEGIIPIESFEPEDDDEDDEERRPSGSSIATAHILSLIKANRDQTAPINPSSGLSTAIYERVMLAHATTGEFLRQFWAAFLSGDPSRANEVISLAESLTKVSERVELIAKDAEGERTDKINSEQARAAEILKRTGRRRVVDVKAIGGGAEVVNHLLDPMLVSVRTAEAKFKLAYDDQIQDIDTVG